MRSSAVFTTVATFAVASAASSDELYCGRHTDNKGLDGCVMDYDPRPAYTAFHNDPAVITHYNCQELCGYDACCLAFRYLYQGGANASIFCTFYSTNKKPSELAIPCPEDESIADLYQSGIQNIWDDGCPIHQYDAKPNNTAPPPEQQKCNPNNRIDMQAFAKNEFSPRTDIDNQEGCKNHCEGQPDCLSFLWLEKAIPTETDIMSHGRNQTKQTGPPTDYCLLFRDSIDGMTSPAYGECGALHMADIGNSDCNLS